MIIDCISDLHGHFPKLEGGDLLIVAGDLTTRDDDKGYTEFEKWFDSQQYRKKIFICGNHDNQLEKGTFPLYINGYSEYLCDSGTEFEDLKIWGSPWTLAFKGMNPRCKAFTVNTEEELAEKYKLIPDDIDILVTHSPPYGTRDRCMDYKGNIKFAGSKSLQMKIYTSLPKLKLLVCGHIHESYGIDPPGSIFNCKIINACHVNEQYQPVNPSLRVIL